MSVALVSSVVVVVVASAIRSTWSPCGWSMLSTITPLSERGRGHRFGITAAWFVSGAVVGGGLLGVIAAIGAVVVEALSLSSTTRIGVAAALALAAAALDARIIGPSLPHQRRQVNEEWLDEFRPWVYSAGFGVQIGSGLATYVMTGGVYVVVALGALTADIGSALLIGIAFGTLRGLAVLAGVRNTDPRRLARFHRSFARLDEPVRRCVAGALGGTGLGLAVAAAGGPSVLPMVAGVVAGTGVAIAGAVTRPTHQTEEIVTLSSAPLITDTSDDLLVKEPTTA